MNQMVVEQKYWNNSYSTYKFARLPANDPTRRLIEDYLPKANKDNVAFELGCFPGRFLIEVGQKGYILNGCDLAPQINISLKDWCVQNGCKVGEFYNDSYTKFLDKQYDLVASFGFIEHFENYEEVFLQQERMVKEGGILLVQFPNFRGKIQLWLHRFFDIDNLNNHVIPSMNLKRYKELLPGNYEILYCSYYGNFDFWIDDYQKRNGTLKRKLLSLFYKTFRFWKIFPNSSMYSPYAAIIARKRQ